MAEEGDDSDLGEVLPSFELVPLKIVLGSEKEKLSNLSIEGHPVTSSMISAYLASKSFQQWAESISANDFHYLLCAKYDAESMTDAEDQAYGELLLCSLHLLGLERKTHKLVLTYKDVFESMERLKAKLLFAAAHDLKIIQHDDMGWDISDEETSIKIGEGTNWYRVMPFLKNGDNSLNKENLKEALQFVKTIYGVPW